MTTLLFIHAKGLTKSNHPKLFAATYQTSSANSVSKLTLCRTSLLTVSNKLHTSGTGSPPLSPQSNNAQNSCHCPSSAVGGGGGSSNSSINGGGNLWLIRSYSSTSLNSNSDNKSTRSDRESRNLEQSGEKEYSNTGSNNTNSNSKLVTLVNKIGSSRSMIIGGSLLGAGIVSKMLYNFTYTILHVSPSITLYYGFLGGIITASTAAGFAYYTERSFRSIDPDVALRSALAIINTNEQVKTLLNEKDKNNQPLQSGKVKSYVVSGGGVGRNQESVLPVWNHPEIQLNFTIYGSGGEALVTAVYSKKGFKSEIDYVGIDYVSDPNFFRDLTPPLVLFGDSSKYTARRLMKSHASVLARS